ncbi:MAG: hypothetical protein ABIS28_12555 [Caldimonas sp.]
MTPFQMCSMATALAAIVGLAGCGGSSSSEDAAAIPLTVPKAVCGTDDKPEAGLQGQVPAAVRAAGFKGYNCNLTLVGQSRNEGASWQHAYFKDKAGHNCFYYDTSSSTANRTNRGVVAIDATDAANPKASAFLTTTAMIDPWESLKVNDRRQLLGAVNALNGNGGPELDLYDISGDCRSPQLLTTSAVNTGIDGGLTTAVRGHEGDFAPDGLTYYGSNLGAGYVYAIDITSTVRPKMIAQWQNPYVNRLHGQSLSEDGNRMYLTSAGVGAADPTRPPPPATYPNNGLIIVDTSEVQARKPNAVIREVGHVFWDDARTAQHTIPVKIKGKPYVIFADEGGGGASNAAGWQAACDAGLPSWPMARIIDIGDETKPVVVSKLALEIHDPKNCANVIPDLAGLSGFTYGAHYCSVDNKQEATTLACGYFESGIRVFDIRDPLRPKEIAYYNPPAVTTPSAGSQNNRTAANGRPDHCSAQLRLDAAAKTLSTTCQDNGFLSLKFRDGVWPFPESKTPAGQQN